MKEKFKIMRITDYELYLKATLSKSDLPPSTTDLIYELLMEAFKHGIKFANDKLVITLED
jgi:hypothetical protein